MDSEEHDEEEAAGQSCWQKTELLAVRVCRRTDGKVLLATQAGGAHNDGWVIIPNFESYPIRRATRPVRDGESWDSDFGTIRDPNGLATTRLGAWLPWRRRYARKAVFPRFAGNRTTAQKCMQTRPIFLCPGPTATTPPSPPLSSAARWVLRNMVALEVRNADALSHRR